MSPRDREYKNKPLNTQSTVEKKQNSSQKQIRIYLQNNRTPVKKKDFTVGKTGSHPVKHKKSREKRNYDTAKIVKEFPQECTKTSRENRSPMKNTILRKTERNPVN